MDGEGPLLDRFQALLTAFDDEALAALANRGLVRRARKDVESAAPTILEPDGDRLRLDMGDATVTIDPTPSRSVCSCPASGTCRHILAALIFLREAGSSPGRAGITPLDQTPSSADEICAVTDLALAKWAGKALVGRAMQALAHGLAVEFEESGAVIARFPTRNVTCRWMPGGGLAGMVCSCHAPEACEHKVAAVLAFQVASGRRTLDDAEPSARRPRPAPADRAPRFSTR